MFHHLFLCIHIDKAFHFLFINILCFSCCLTFFAFQHSLYIYYCIHYSNNNQDSQDNPHRIDWCKFDHKKDNSNIYVFCAENIYTVYPLLIYMVYMVYMVYLCILLIRNLVLLLPKKVLILNSPPFLYSILYVPLG